MTGLTPYFMLYGQHPMFPWDITDTTWQGLHWEKAQNDREELLAIRALQILRRDEDIDFASWRQALNRNKSIDQHMLKLIKHMQVTGIEPVVWVLRRENRLDTGVGGKEKPRFMGPYVVKRRFQSGSYQLAELDGTPILEPVSADRLVIYRYRGNVIVFKPKTPMESLRVCVANYHHLSQKRLAQDYIYSDNFFRRDMRIHDLQGSQVMLTNGAVYRITIGLADIYDMVSDVHPWW